MKILKQFTFTLIAVLGLSLAGYAQKDGPKKPPPKDPPPKINPSRPKDPPPKDPKKPGMSALIIIARENEDA
ncbi:MAG TPA: hypothetical protein VK918_05135 [Pyrinomonadaceae bacterium]|nr:hypothetical protein [Pyrinomonadaceae bacterium]